MSKAEKQRAKHARSIARQQRRAKARRLKKKRLQDQEPLPDPFPNTEGLSEEEAAKVWEQFFFWEDYADRNPSSAPTGHPCRWPELSWGR